MWIALSIVRSFARGVFKERNNSRLIYDMLYTVAARRSNGVLIANDSVLAAICKRNNLQTC
jgi:predicted nucleic acid-binding protein